MVSCYQELVEAYAAEAKATGRPQLMLTAAVSAGKGTIDAGYEIAEIAKYYRLKFWAIALNCFFS